MAETDPASVIEEVLRSTVLPALVYRVRAENDGELALSILAALEENGFEVIRKIASQA